MSNEQIVLKVEAAEITKSFLEDLQKLSDYSGCNWSIPIILSIIYAQLSTKLITSTHQKTE